MEKVVDDVEVKDDKNKVTKRNETFRLGCYVGMVLFWKKEIFGKTENNFSRNNFLLLFK